MKSKKQTSIGQRTLTVASGVTVTEILPGAVNVYTTPDGDVQKTNVYVLDAAKKYRAEGDFEGDGTFDTFVEVSNVSRYSYTFNTTLYPNFIARLIEV